MENKQAARLNFSAGFSKRYQQFFDLEPEHASSELPQMPETQLQLFLQQSQQKHLLLQLQLNDTAKTQLTGYLIKQLPAQRFIFHAQASNLYSLLTLKQLHYIKRG